MNTSTMWFNSIIDLNYLLNRALRNVTFYPACLLLLLIGNSSATAQETFNTYTDSLDGYNGFTIYGAEVESKLANDFLVLDLNNDGIDDLVIGEPGYNSNVGRLQVLYGSEEGFSYEFQTSDIDSTQGFTVTGASAGEWLGYALAKGDVNNDGIEDIIMSAHNAKVNGVNNLGRVYVLFGRSTPYPSNINLSDLTSSTGLTIYGNSADAGFIGIDVASGDVNNDTYDDIIIGAPYSTVNGNYNTGKVIVVFGTTSFGTDSLNINDIDGTNGFYIEGINGSDETGYNIESGDINNDNYDDIFIGVIGDDTNGSNAGKVYVVNGKSSFSTPINLINFNSSTGLYFDGIAAGDKAGNGLGTGDINNDGIDDLFIGATEADIDGKSSSGEIYAILGSSTIDSTLTLSNLNGTNGFKISGHTYNHKLGSSFSVGDLNNDLTNDLVIGATKPTVIFGDGTFSDSLNVAQLDGTNGFLFQSHSSYNTVSVAIADVNNDGSNDLIAGDRGGDYPSTANSGAIDVFYNLDTINLRDGAGFKMLSTRYHGNILQSLLNNLWTQGMVGADTTGGSANVWNWDSSTQNWVALTSTSGTINAGQGLLYYNYEADNIPPMAVPLYGGAPDTTADSLAVFNGLADQNFELIGNPFNKDLDWDDASDFKKTNLTNVIYSWNETANAGSGAWESWNGFAGDIADGTFSQNTSYFVQADGVGSLTIYDNYTPPCCSFPFELVGSKHEPKVLSLNLNAEDFSSHAWFTFNDEGQLSRDRYDALALESYATSYLELAAILPNGDLVQTNSLPLNQRERMEFPIVANGNIGIEIAELTFGNLEQFEGWDIYLIDSKTGTEYKIDNNSKYSIELGNVVAKKKMSHIPTPSPIKRKGQTSRYSIAIIPGENVSNEEVVELPEAVELQQNYPNPFNPSTTIAYGLPQSGKVTLEVFDVIGRKVATLINGETKSAGRYTVRFDARNLASGMYIYRLQTGAKVLSKKFTLIK
ncbi:T9SS type A sorting domain-containing protein [Balneola vulgaris]|uniref:T9SS type A sorting domain-containing protein n=1 Tax=Balneola vulgaris TaxID=287535 RepID=UPI00068674F9|nr:T9SS type A sorting domain-containing protein [Balneola vulgaris]